MSQNPGDLAPFPNVNLLEYPESVRLCEGQTVTVGDMHGNAMKLLWVLCYFGIIELEDPESDWEALWGLYSTDIEHLTKRQLDDFDLILKEASIGQSLPSKLILVGDILADRGQNDFFTLIVLKNIHREVNYKILLSNHDLITLVYFEGEDKLSLIEDMNPACRLSFENLKKLFINDPTLKPIFHHLLKTIYHPNMVLFDMEPNDSNQYLIYSHAVFKIELLVECLHDEHQPLLQNTPGLMVIFNLLNSKLQRLLVQNILYTFASILTDLVWERELSPITMHYLEALGLINIHGHNTEPVIEMNRRCLDTPIGRPQFHNEETGEIIPAIYTGKFIFHTNTLRAPVLQDREDAQKPQKASLSSHRETMFSSKGEEDKENHLTLPPKKRKYVSLKA